ncbi:hypothetical protein EON63_22685 [archaeon]|nr:MAG: hypothetical protein EON63_22685 [archaeon]
MEQVWDNVIRQPEEMLQRRNDGSFYTNVPVDMWEAINQHISLATSTSSPILHVMIADKVVMTMNDVFNKIIDYVNTLDTKDHPELREVELEYVSALANDTALHIEEVSYFCCVMSVLIPISISIPTTLNIHKNIYIPNPHPYPFIHTHTHTHVHTHTHT